MCGTLALVIPGSQEEQNNKNIGSSWTTIECLVRTSCCKNRKNKTAILVPASMEKEQNSNSGTGYHEERTKQPYWYWLPWRKNSRKVNHILEQHSTCLKGLCHEIFDLCFFIICFFGAATEWYGTVPINFFFQIAEFQNSKMLSALWDTTWNNVFF